MGDYSDPQNVIDMTGYYSLVSIAAFSIGVSSDANVLLMDRPVFLREV